MAYTEYPKALYGAKGWDDLSDYVRVHSAAEETDARAKGYRPLAEIEKAAVAEGAAPGGEKQPDTGTPKPKARKAPGGEKQ